MFRRNQGITLMFPIVAGVLAIPAIGAPGAVYTITNSAGGNSVVMYSRSADGSPMTIIMLALVCGVVGAALYPPASYDHFARAVAACFLIGLAQATVVCSPAFFVLRRGAPVSPQWMGATVVLVGGLTGMIVLYVFCPHRDLGHVLLGHAPMPAAVTAIGAWIGRSGRMRAGAQR